MMRLQEIINYISYEIMNGWMSTHGEKFETYIIRRLAHRFGIDDETVNVIRYILDPEFKERILTGPHDQKLIEICRNVLEEHFNG